MHFIHVEFYWFYKVFISKKIVSDELQSNKTEYILKSWLACEQYGWKDGWTVF